MQPERSRQRERRPSLGRELLTLAVLVACFALVLSTLSAVRANAAQPAQPAPTATADDTVRDAGATAYGVVASLVDLVADVLGAVWHAATWAADRILEVAIDSWLSPLTGRSTFVPGGGQWAVSVLAAALLAVVAVILAGPLYASWQTWRARQHHVYHR